MSLTILSFGAGQDSTALLYETIYNPQFRLKYNIDLREFIVLMAGTGNEHDNTEEHVTEIKKFCNEQNVPFHHLLPQNGFHPKGWNKGLIEFYERTTTCGSKAFRKTCTDNLKIKPIYKFVNYYLIGRYGLLHELLQKAGPKTKEKFNLGTDHIQQSFLFKKDAIKLYAQKHGKINMMIGIAKGEEVRASGNEESREAWMRIGINKLYPLIDLGLDRQACQDLITGYNKPVPMPSNCILCPFMSLQELLYLYRFHLGWYHRWVIIEAAKLERFKHLGDKNLGVWGKKPLPVMLEEAVRRYGDWSDERLKEYKNSHGHCVKSKY